MKRSSANLKILTILTLTTLLVQPLPISAAPYTPNTLFLTVYTDGNTLVEYSLTADPNIPRITVPLFGQLYTEILVTNGEDSPLDHSVANGTATIDTLGATAVNIFYTTPDLIDKDGAVWTLEIDAPIPFSIRFPQEATIIGISSIPLSITTTDTQYILTMNPGHQTASYSTGIVGTKEQANVTIKNTELAVEQAKAEAVESPEAEEALNQAKQAYNEGRYMEAEQAATQAQRLLEQARTQTTETTTTQPTNPDMLLLISWIIAAAAVATLALFLIRRKGHRTTPYEKEIRSIDLETILRSRPQLRFEDIEALQYLADSGGEAFETEIRERFKLPKTTIWRQVRRLQREGLVEVRKIGGQNLIRIREEGGGAR